MTDSSTLEIHVSTDLATGDLDINFDPVGSDTIPVSIVEWPDVRSDLRERVRDQIEGPDEWKAYLSSERLGERLDVQIGHVVVSEEGEVLDETLHATSVDDVDWEQ